MIEEAFQSSVFDREDEDGTAEAEEKIRHEDAKRSFEIAMWYIEQQDEASPLDSLFVQKWRDLANSKFIRNQEQKKITDFFRK